METKTIFDVYSDFLAVSTKINKSTLRSVIHRFLAEEWGGVAPKGAKATNEEIFAFIELLKSKPANLLLGSMEVLEQEFKKKNIARENSKSYKSAYKSFFDWVEKTSYCSQPKKEEVKPNITTRLFNKQPNGTGVKHKSSYHNKITKKPYALMGKHNGRTECNGKIKEAGELIYETDYINSSLRNEIKLFEDFRRENYNCCKATIEKEIREIYRFLGWLHRYKNIPLDKLRLTSIISFVELNLSYKNFKDKNGKSDYQGYVIAKDMARQEAIDLANENKKIIEEYTNFVGGHPNTKKMVMTACIPVAKFIFKDEIEADDDIDYSDLPIIKRLNYLSDSFSKKAKSVPPAVAHADKSIPWSETSKVLELLRQRVHCLEIECVSTEKTKNGNKRYISKRPRERSTIANSLQRFLSLAFMILIPVDRARTYYELEIGRTFVSGLYKDGNFIPAEKLQDKNQALWYIHLKEGDYKTSKIYGEYWGIMPNSDFGDGNKLYDYIAQWINEGRECEQKCNHRYFFREIRTYQPMEAISWGNRIKAIFINQTNIPVTPKELRKMYITYLNNIGATNTQLKGAAYSMHHSERIQQSDYNSQNSFERVAPIMDLNERIWKEAFSASPDNYQ